MDRGYYTIIGLLVVGVVYGFFRKKPTEEKKSNLGWAGLSGYSGSDSNIVVAAHQEIQKLALIYPAGSAGSGGVLSFDQVENAVLNVARYNVFKLSEAVLAGQPVRVAWMIDGLQAEGEGESEVLVHWALAEDIRSLKRVKDAIQSGRPMPMALRENRVLGAKEKLFERVLPGISEAALAGLLNAAQKVDRIVKGLKQPDWPVSGWQALHRLAGMFCGECAGLGRMGGASAGRFGPRGAR